MNAKLNFLLPVSQAAHPALDSTVIFHVVKFSWGLAGPSKRWGKRSVLAFIFYIWNMPSKPLPLKFTISIHIERRHPWRVLRVSQKCEGPIAQKTLRYKWIMKDFLMSERNVITLQGWDILLTPQISILVSLKNIKNNIYLNPLRCVCVS